MLALYSNLLKLYYLWLIFVPNQGAQYGFCYLPFYTFLHVWFKDGCTPKFTFLGCFLYTIV